MVVQLLFNPGLMKQTSLLAIVLPRQLKSWATNSEGREVNDIITT